MNVPQEISTEITSPRDTGPLIQLEQLSRRDRGAVLLNQINLSIYPGQRIALIGPSGSGKTLLLRSLAMLDPLSSGQILWQGKSVAHADVPQYRSQVTYLHQRSALVEATVEENLRAPYSLQIYQNKSYDPARIRAMLKQLGRDDSFLVKQQSELSGGESQLIALLRVLQLDPIVLLLDEPTAALDQETSLLVEKLIEDWHSQRPAERAVVWISHNEEQTKRVSNAILSMKNGQLLGDHDG
ncbi:MAG: ABC transporter ATP-binding protein [Pirellulales bacterium]